MKIKLILPTVTVVGPTVAVSLTDRGKAQVSLTLVLSDGTTFSSAGGLTTPPETTLPSGKYDCVAVISAFNHGAFGEKYDSHIEIAGQEVASAKGNVPDNTHESSTTAFLLEVK